MGTLRSSQRSRRVVACCGALVSVALVVVLGWTLLATRGTGVDRPEGLDHKGARAAASATARHTPTTTPGIRTGAPSEGNAPFDIGKVIEQVHFAFRQEGGAWKAAHATHEVRLEGGELVMTPRAPGGPGGAVRFAAAQASRGSAALEPGTPASGNVTQ